MDDDRTPRERPEIDDDSTPQELVARYLTGPALLRDTVAGMDADQLHARPIPGKMSTQEVVNHIVDSERSMSERMRRAIAGEEPVAIGGAGHPGPQQHPERDAAADVEALGTMREQMAEDLRPLAPEVWGRIALRREDRVLTLRQVLLHDVRHLEHHVATIEEKRAALGL
jgi:uncharacterized damage-inducible protein DinB